MSITLESHPCPGCGQENSIHIDKCFQCGSTLPWAGAESTKALTGPRKLAGYEAQPSASPAKTIAVYLVGGVIFVFGVLLWLGNVTHLFPTFPLAGYGTMTLGGVVWGVGDRWLMGRK